MRVTGASAAPTIDHVGVAALDERRALADGVAGRGARAGDREVGALGAGLDGDHAGQHVGQHHRDDERADPIRSARVQGDRRVDDGADATDAAADDDPHALGVVGRDLEAGVADGFLRGNQAELQEAVHPARFLAIEELGGIEAFDLPRDTDVEVVRFEALDWSDARAAVDDVVPGSGHVEADRRQRTHARNHNATGLHLARGSITLVNPVSFARPALALRHAEC